MGKTETKRERELAERLHALGLRRRVARNIARSATTVRPQLPDAARSALKDVLEKVDELGGRATKKGKGRAAGKSPGGAGGKPGKATAAPKKKKKKGAKHH